MTDEPNQAPVDEKMTRIRPLWTARASLLVILCGIATYPFTAYEYEAVPFTAILLSVALGVLATFDAPRKPHPRRDEWWANAGIIISLILGFMMLGNQHKHRTFPDMCADRLNLLSKAAYVYSGAHQDCLPPSERWDDELKVHVKKLTGHGTGISGSQARVCSGNRGRQLTPFAMNSNLDRGYLGHVKHPSQAVLFFESIPGRNRSGGPELFPPKPRHRDGYLIAFVDGHVRYVPKSEIGKLIWEPEPTK